MSDLTFTVEDVSLIHQHLRVALGLPREQFDVASLIDMLRDEIEEGRNAGLSDVAIASVIHYATHKRIDPEAITRYYGTAEVSGKM